MPSFKDQVRDFVDEHLTVVSENPNEFMCYCPFHKNNDSPAFTVNKHTGLYFCHNPNCGEKGWFNHLIFKITGERVHTKPELTEDDLMKAIMEDKPRTEGEDFSMALEGISLNYNEPRDIEKLEYLIDRGFHPTILKHFEIAYSEKQGRIVIPLRDEHYKVVGFIGRAIDPEVKQRYKYSEGLPKASILFNLNNAKHYPDVYVTEGSLDAIKVHQAGYPNVVSTLGASVAPHQLTLLNQYFKEITILSDNDPAGENMKKSIIAGCPRLTIYTVHYPEGKKDPGELTDKEVRELINGRTDYLSELFGF